MTIIKEKKPELKEKYTKLYLINEFDENENNKCKLSLSDENDENEEILKDIIEKEKYDEKYKDSNLAKNYEYLKKQIKENNIECVINGLFRLMIVEIKLNKGEDDPQRIFESLNSTGLNLSQSDLIRNYLLMDLPKGKQEKLYKSFWKKIEKNTTNDKKTNPKDFIRDYLIMKNNRAVTNKNKIYEEFKKFREKGEKKYTPDKNESFLDYLLKDMKEHSEYYSKLINTKINSHSQIEVETNYFNMLETKVPYPFLLALFNDMENNLIEEETFINILKLIQSFLVRIIILSLDKELNKIFASLSKKINKENDKTYLPSLEEYLVKNKRFPNDEKIKTELKNKNIYNIPQKEYILYKLENHNNKELVNLESPNITIEHIFPQNPNKIWENNLSEEEFQEMKERTNTLANLTLIGNNRSLGNKSFIEKRDLKEKGYKDSKLYLNKFLAGLDEWNIEKLNERYELLFEKFKEIWKHPNLEIDYNNKIFNLDNEFDFNGNKEKLDHIFLKNNKYNIGSFKACFEIICKEIYKNEPWLFKNEEVIKKLKINKDKLQTPITIGNIKIEGNGSKDILIQKIRFLLGKSENFSLEDFSFKLK